jgi:ATP-dependent Clp protease adapter protein ClpS
MPVLEPTTIPTTDTDIDFDQLAARFPDYVVLLWNDPVTPMEIVVYALQQSIPGMKNEDAVSHMIEAHTTGKSAVARCKIEEAELYRDRLTGFKLTASIEEA